MQVFQLELLYLFMWFLSEERKKGIKQEEEEEKEEIEKEKEGGGGDIEVVEVVVVKLDFIVKEVFLKKFKQFLKSVLDFRRLLF